MGVDAIVKLTALLIGHLEICGKIRGSSGANDRVETGFVELRSMLTGTCINKTEACVVCIAYYGETLFCRIFADGYLQRSS